MNRITLAGALFLALIAILPTLVGKILGVDATISYFFGGTSLVNFRRCRAGHDQAD